MSKGLKPGFVLSDKSTFALVEDLLSAPKDFKAHHLLALENLISVITCHENIEVLIGDGLIDTAEIRLPNILRELVNKKLVSLEDSSLHKTQEHEILNDLVDDIKKENWLEKVPVYLSESYRDLKSFFAYYFRAEERPRFFAFLKSHGIDPVWENTNIVATMQRILIYLTVSNEWKVPYLPFFIRQHVIDGFPLFESRVSVAQKIIRSIETAKKMSLTKEIEFFEIKNYNIEVPLLTGYVLSQCTEPSDIIDEILRLREDGRMTAFRRRCTKLTKAIYEYDQAIIDRNFRVIHEVLEKEFGDEICYKVIKALPEIVLSPQKKASSLVPDLMSAGIEWLRKRDLIFLTKEVAGSILSSGKDLEKVFGRSFTHRDKESLQTLRKYGL